jgi:hypothetical protein
MQALEIGIRAAVANLLRDPRRLLEDPSDGVNESRAIERIQFR